MTITDTLQHEDFCLPRPGQLAPRIEPYSVPRYSSDGLAVAGSVWCVRCIECGVSSYDGVQRG